MKTFVVSKKKILEMSDKEQCIYLYSLFTDWGICLVKNSIKFTDDILRKKGYIPGSETKKESRYINGTTGKIVKYPQQIDGLRYKVT